MPEISFDWVWLYDARDKYLTLSDADRVDLLLRPAFISANPWPDIASKRFFNDLPPELWRQLVNFGSSWHVIVYMDESWILVYEVVQPLVFVIYSFARST